MIEFMLDTDSCIYLINRHPKMQRKAPPNACGISVIVLGELERAALLSTRPEPTMEFINRITPVDLTDDVAECYANIRVTLEQQGNIIVPNDLWIAAHAAAMEVPLVTNNTKEFSRVTDLRIDNWLMT